MDSLLVKAGGWFALAFLAFVAMVLAADGGFAVHMMLVMMACLIALWVTISNADYTAIGRGILNAPADPGQYDDDPIRWGVIATLFWGMAGFAVGL
ncbi:MAG: cytochrome-c oxidase, cbb3-type subunit I, partial [Parasphingorhabdus sp.]